MTSLAICEDMLIYRLREGVSSVTATAEVGETSQVSSGQRSSCCFFFAVSQQNALGDGAGEPSLLRVPAHFSSN